MIPAACHLLGYIWRREAENAETLGGVDYRRTGSIPLLPATLKTTDETGEDRSSWQAEITKQDQSLSTRTRAGNMGTSCGLLHYPNNGCQLAGLLVEGDPGRRPAGAASPFSTLAIRATSLGPDTRSSAISRKYFPPCRWSWQPSGIVTCQLRDLCYTESPHSDNMTSRFNKDYRPASAPSQVRHLGVLLHDSASHTWPY